ncbi:MAG: DMT family transporter, partial [Micropruina sp.]|uniref:DMT family transporter n=1 Tax=Micropruina sp. TaxID=2737536 RepID=UPI0039E6CD38
VARVDHPRHVAASGPVTPGRIALYTLMTTVWGSSFFFTALALDAFTPFQIVFIRMLLATVILAVVVAVIRPRWPRTAALWRHFVLLGLISIALPYTLLTWAQVWVDSSTAIVLSSTTPIFVFLIATLGLRTEVFGVGRLVAVGIAFAGVVVLTLGSSGGSGNLFWSVVIVVTSANYAAANVYTKRFVSMVHPLLTALLQLGFGTVWLLPVLLISGDWRLPAHVGPGSLLAVLELGTLGSAFGYVLFFYFIATWGSTITSLNTYLQPLVGISLGVLVLGERPGWQSWLGIGIVLAGVVWFGVSTLRAAPGRRPLRRFVDRAAR